MQIEYECSACSFINISGQEMRFGLEMNERQVTH